MQIARLARDPCQNQGSDSKAQLQRQHENIPCQSKSYVWFGTDPMPKYASPCQKLGFHAKTISRQFLARAILWGRPPGRSPLAAQYIHKLPINRTAAIMLTC